jgi:hypothetical protein
MAERRAPNQITAIAIEQAVARGIQAAVSDPATWEAAGKAMRTQAEQSAGGWLLAGLRAAFKKLAWVVLVCVLVYNLGGLPALTALMKGQGFGSAP